MKKALARKQKTAFIVLATLGVWALYVVISAAAPVDQKALMQYNLSLLQAKVFGIVIAMPVLVGWLLIANATEKIRHYARLLGESLDGKGFRLMAWGLGLTLVSTMANIFVGTLLPYAHDNQLFFQIVTISRNMLTIGLQLAAFIALFASSLALRRLVKKHVPVWFITCGMILLGVLLVFYLQLLFSNPNRSLITTTAVNSYELPDPLIWLLIVVPLVVGWVYGVLALGNMWVFFRFIQGTIYRSALRMLGIGITIVLVFSILVQILSQFFSAPGDLTLGSILILIAFILAVWVAGFWFIALGANKLRRIEEINAE